MSHINIYSYSLSLSSADQLITITAILIILETFHETTRRCIRLLAPLYVSLSSHV
jgi:hypothetical protein